MQIKQASTIGLSIKIEDELIERNNYLRDNHIPDNLLIASRFVNVTITDFLTGLFLQENGYPITSHPQDNLRSFTSRNINEYVIAVLNDIGRTTFDLGFLDIDYKLPSDSQISEAMRSTKRDAQIEVKISGGGQAGFTREKLDAFITTKDIRFGYFPIHLWFYSNSKNNRSEQHRVAGFIDKFNKTIYVYDGARWIDFKEGIDSLKKCFNELLPNYEVEVLAKSHQTVYGTCSMFQPTVVYMMLLYKDPHFIISYLNNLNGIERESVIDNVAMSIFNYQSSPKIMSSLSEDEQTMLCALFRVVMKSSNEELEQLLALGISPNQVCRRAEDDPLINLAIEKNNLDGVKLLLKAGANPEHANRYNILPLYKAVESGNWEIVQALLLAGANPYKTSNYPIDHEKQRAPLSIAVQNSDTKTTKVLLSANVDPNLAHNPYGTPPLYIASSRGNTDIVKELLAAKASINQRRRKDGETPLYAASSEGHLAVIKLLLAAGADPNIGCDHPHRTYPILAAQHNKHVEAMKELLEGSANPNIPNKKNITPLYLACIKNEVEMVKVLLQFNADPNQDCNGVTPLFIAAQKGFLEIVEILPAHNANMYIPYRTNIESLRRFGKDYQVEQQVEFFIYFKNCSSFQISITPKEVAIILGHTKIVDLLRSIEFKTKFFLTSSEGNSENYGDDYERFMEPSFENGFF